MEKRFSSSNSTSYPEKIFPTSEVKIPIDKPCGMDFIPQGKNNEHFFILTFYFNLKKGGI